MPRFFVVQLDPGTVIWLVRRMPSAHPRAPRLRAAAADQSPFGRQLLSFTATNGALWTEPPERAPQKNARSRKGGRVNLAWRPDEMHALLLLRRKAEERYRVTETDPFEQVERTAARA